jgi:hypothetical protein
MLINQAKNLASLPYSSLQTLQQNVQRTQQLLAQAQNIAFDVQNVDQMFQQKYGKVSLSATDAQLVADARSRWQNTVGGLQDAMRVQAGVVGNIDTNRAEMSALVGQSQNATGALQADTGGQSASRAPVAAAFRPDRADVRQWSLRSPDRSRARHRRRTGPHPARALSDAGIGLSARQCPDVRQRQQLTGQEGRDMDGKMLARLGAIIFVAIAITATVIEMTREDEPAQPRRGPGASGACRSAAPEPAPLPAG